MSKSNQNIKPVFIARAAEGTILSVFRAAGPALSFVAETLSGDTNTTLVCEHSDESFHAVNGKKLTALSTGMTQGQVRTFRVRVAEDSAELTGARVALAAMRGMHQKMADMGCALAADVASAQLAPLVAAVEALESATEDGGPFVTLEAHAPRTRAYGTVGDSADVQPSEATEEPAPETASERAASFRKSVGLK